MAGSTTLEYSVSNLPAQVLNHMRYTRCIPHTTFVICNMSVMRTSRCRHSCEASFAVWPAPDGPFGKLYYPAVWDGMFHLPCFNTLGAGVYTSRMMDIGDPLTLVFDSLGIQETMFYVNRNKLRPLPAVSDTCTYTLDYIQTPTAQKIRNCIPDGRVHHH